MKGEDHLFIYFFKFTLIFNLFLGAGESQEYTLSVENPNTNVLCPELKGSIMRQRFLLRGVFVLFFSNGQKMRRYDLCISKYVNSKKL